jgi:hypothetical protein
MGLNAQLNWPLVTRSQLMDVIVQAKRHPKSHLLKSKLYLFNPKASALRGLFCA